MVFIRCDVFHDFLNYAFEKKIFDKIHTDKVFHPYAHCLGTLAWRKKSFLSRDYYRSQIYAFPD